MIDDSIADARIAYRRDGAAVIRDVLDMGWIAAPGTPEDLARRIAEDTTVWGSVLDRIAK